MPELRNELLFLGQRKRAQYDIVAGAENQVTRRDAPQVAGSLGVKLAPDNNCAQEAALSRLILVIRLQHYLKKMSAAKPPSCPAVLRDRASKQFFRVSNGKPRTGRVQADDLALSVRQRKQVAMAGLPRAFAGILDRRRVSVSQVCRRGEQVGLTGQHHLTLVLNGLDRQDGVASVLLDLPLDLGLSRGAHYKQSGASEHSRK